MIMNEQRERRRMELKASRDKARNEEQHRLDNLAALNQRFKNQMKEFQMVKEAQKKQKEREEALKKKKIDRIVKAHQGNHVTTEVIKPEMKLEKSATNTSGTQQELMKLRAWIESQMNKENMYSSNSVESLEQPLMSSIFDQSAPKVVSIDGPAGDRPKTKSRSRDRS